MKIGIIGNGFVGRSTSLLACEGVEALIYDKDPSLCLRKIAANNAASRWCPLSLQDLADCDLVFICVPTPMDKDGSCHTGIVESVVEELAMIDYPKNRTILRSTVPVGTSEKLGVMFMPEFLTESNWKNDTANLENWIIGFESKGDDPTAAYHNLVYDLLENAHEQGVIKAEPKLTFCDTKSAELAKHGRNAFLATKVSFFCELEEFCSRKRLNFSVVRGLICLDERICDSHSEVPGPDGKRGYGGTCFPKDVASLLEQMIDCGLESYIVEATKARNIQVDRPEMDWEDDKGRAVV